jgi:transcriptional regulator with XRE-family HTH domain
MDQSSINVKRLRKEQKMSLKELSLRSGLSVSFLSNYENGKVNITVYSLRQIAKALGVSIKTLVAAEDDSTILVVPSSKRYSIVNKGEITNGFSQNFVQDFLTRGSTFDMQVTVMHMEPQSTSVLDYHDGEEFVYILNGTILLVFNAKQEIILNKGDMAYYDAHYKHYWINASDIQADFLAVASRVGF